MIPLRDMLQPARQEVNILFLIVILTRVDAFFDGRRSSIGVMWTYDPAALPSCLALGAIDANVKKLEIWRPIEP